MDTITDPTDAVERQEKIAQRLAAIPLPTRLRRPDELDGPVAELRALLGQIDELPPARQDGDLRDRVAERLDAYLDKADRLRLLAEARQDLTERLESARAYLASGAAVNLVRKRYDAAIVAIGELRQTTRNWERIEVEEIEQLEAEAIGARERFAADHEQPTTRKEGEELVMLISQFAEIARRDPDYPVTYFNGPTRAASVIPMPVSQALKWARDILFNRWDEKIAEYLQNAREKLDAHDPRAARVELERCDRLPGRDNAVTGVQLIEDQITSIEKMRALVTAAVEKLEAAEIELRKAENALDPLHPDPLAAEQSFRNAIDRDPYVGGKDRVRARINGAALQEAPSVLDATDRHLSREEWKLADTRLRRAEALLAMLPVAELPDSRARYDGLRAVYSDVEPLVDGRTLTFDEQRARLERLAESYADTYWSQWSGLAARLDKLRTRRDLEALVAEAEAVGESNAIASNLVDLLERLGDIERNFPPEAPTEAEARLAVVIPRVRAWLGFAQMRDELAKAPLGSISTDVAADDLDLEEGADLRVAADGFAKARGDGRARAAAARLEQRLRQLQRNDERAAADLKVAQDFLQRVSTPDVEQLRKQLSPLANALTRPSSHRRELLLVYHEIRDRLATLLEAEFRRLLADGRSDFYAKQKDGDIEASYKELLSLRRGEDAAVLTLAAEVELARGLARAQRIERDAARSIKTWQDAQEAWEKARDRADEESGAYDFAHYRARQARKQSIFREAESAETRNPIDAASLLRVLVEDLTLQGDWQVWYRHGRAAFAVVLASVDPNKPFSANQEGLPRARESFDMARVSMRRAASLLSGRELTTAIETADARALGELEASLEEWDAFVRALGQHYQELSDPWPRHANCLRLVQIHERLVEQPTQAKPASGQSQNGAVWYSRLWNQVRMVAKSRLQERLSALAGQPDSILEQLDALLGLIILFPDDDAVQQQLSNQAVTILRALQTLVEETPGDYSAARFSARFLRREKRTPEPTECLEKQIEEARQTTASLYDYNHTFNTAKLAGFPHNSQRLGEWGNQLEQWVDELENANDALTNARRLAEDGLADARQFDRANRVLRQTQTVDGELAQVPEQFVNANHPTYRAVAAAMKLEQDRRQKQVALRDQINHLIGHEQAAVALALRWRRGETLDEDERAQVSRLPADLKQLRKALQQMIEEEPDDPTLLQQQLSYSLPEDPDVVVRGADRIEVLIGEKLEQHRQAQAWLSEWSNDAGLHNVVNWEKASHLIASQRDRGPEGLNRALHLCREARDGADNSGMRNGKWALRPALRALTLQEMANALKLAPEQTAGGAGWYGLIEPLNQTRLSLVRRLEADVTASERMEENIRWRASHYQARLDKVTLAKEQLLSNKRPWRGWLDMPEWREFAKAVDEFCQICPALPRFEEQIKEVRAITGLTVGCSDADGGDR